MNQPIQCIIQRLEVHIYEADQSGDRYDFIDPASELCMELAELENAAEAIEPLFRLIERSPAIDYGGPGPLGQFLEAFEGGMYEEQLLQSLRRKPTLYTISLLDILLQDGNDPRQALYLETMQTIAVNADLAEVIQREATDNLKYVIDNLYPWTDELQEQLSVIKKWLEETTEPEEQHELFPTVSTVEHNGIVFKVITRDQAKMYMPNITDLPGISGQLYEVWDNTRFPVSHKNAYFLLAEEDVLTDELDLDFKIPGREDITVLGFIFTANLKTKSYILAYNTDKSPALIVHGDVNCPYIHLSGNRHYIGGHLRTDLLWTKYNHGELYLNGSIDARVILADDMPIFIRQVSNIVATISMMGMNIYLKTGADWLQQPATHQIEEIFFPEVCITNDEGEIVLKEEGRGSAVEYIKQNKPLLK